MERNNEMVKIMEFINDNQIEGENDSIQRGKVFTETSEYQGFPYKLGIVVHTKKEGYGSKEDTRKKWVVLEYTDNMKELVQQINNLADQCEFYFDQDKTPFLWADTAYSKYDEHNLKEKVEEMHKIAHTQIRLLADLEFAYREWNSTNMKSLNGVMRKVRKLQLKKI